MKHSRGLLAFALALIAFTSAPSFQCESTEGLLWRASFAEALAESIMERKSLFVHVGADSAEAQEKFEMQLLGEDDLVQLMNSCIAVKLDGDEQQDLMNMLGIEVLPTNIVFDWLGNELYRASNMIDTTGLIDTLESQRLRWKFEYERYYEAVNIFKKIVAMDTEADAGLIDKAHLALAVAAWRGSGPPAALGLFQVYLAHYPESDCYNLGRFYYGLLLKDLRRDKEAAEFLAVAATF